MASPVRSDTVAVIGLGSMGAGMAHSLLSAGLPVTACDVRPEAVERFVSEGGKGAASPAAAAAGADIVIVVVVNADQTEHVLFGPDGAVAAAKPDAVIISSATMAPDRARKFGERVAATGRLYLDAPISGGAAKAAEGALTVMASGSPAAFARARPALDRMATKVFELGDEPGIGASFKMVNQLLAGVHIAAASEAMVLAKKLGLDLARVYEVITASAGNSWMFENRMKNVIAGDYSPRSAVEIFVKDLGIVSDISRSERATAPIAATALQLYLMAAAAGMGREDDSSVARIYARLMGVELPGPR